MFLSSLAANLKSWNQNWRKGLSNDPFPYGYCWAESDEVSVSYVEGRVINNAILRKLYNTFVLPTKAFEGDALWTHFEADAYKIALFKKIPFLKRRLPKQVACFIWLADNYHRYGAFKRWLVRWLIRDIEHIIYLSPTEAAFFSEVIGLKDDKHSFVPFGINLDVYRDGPVTPVEHVETPFILSLGNDVHRDIDTLERLGTKLEGKAKIVFATRNPEFVKRLSSHRNIQVVSADLKQIRWLYRECLFVVIPLLYNEHASGCTTILEASVNGKAVIATRTPGLDAYIRDRETGYLVERSQPAQFYDKVFDLLENEERREAMGKAGASFVREGSFTTRAWAKTHVLLTKKLLHSERG